MSEEIVIEQENGKLTGKDPETGETVPVAFKSTNIDRLSIGPGHEHVDPADGTGGIQQAHDDLPASGGLITLSSGRYTVDNTDDPWDDPPILVTKDNIAIIGQGRETEIFLPDNATVKDTYDKGARIIHVGGEDNTDLLNGTNQYDGFYIADLTINGNRQNNQPIGDPRDGHNIQIQGSETTVHNVWSINSTGDGVEPISRATDANGKPQSKHITISDCHLLDNEEHHVHIHGAENFSVIGNVCDGEQMGALFSLNSHKTDVLDGTVTGNVFRNGQAIGARLSADDSSNVAKDITFAGNIVKNVGGSAIVIDGNSENVRVSDNTIRSALRGIILKGGNDITIADNTFAEVDQRAIFGSASSPYRGIRIIDNEFLEANQAAAGVSWVKFDIDGQTFERVRFRDNEFFNSSTQEVDKGIWFAETTSGSYSSIIVENNQMQGMKRPYLGVHDELTGSPVQARYNTGYTTENSGTASKADGGTIGHSLNDTPPIENCRLTTASSNRAYITATDNSNLTIALEDPSGAAVTTAETIYWEAKTHER